MRQLRWDFFSFFVEKLCKSFKTSLFLLQVAKCLLDRRDALLGMEAQPAGAQLAPDRFFCSLTLEVMQDPVRVSTGQVYEREIITQWLRCNLTPRCPNTNLVLKSKALTAVPELKAEIDAWRGAERERLRSRS